MMTQRRALARLCPMAAGHASRALASRSFRALPDAFPDQRGRAAHPAPRAALAPLMPFAASPYQRPAAGPAGNPAVVRFIHTQGPDASEGVASEPTAPPAPALTLSESREPIYTGPMSVTVRRVKILSAASLIFNCIGAPIIVYLGSPEMALQAKMGICSSFVVFGVFTTGLLHWFTTPYVHKLWHDGKDGFEVETLNVMAMPRKISFTLDDLTDPASIRPLTSFAVRGKLLYVDENKWEGDEAPLRMLVPEEEEVKNEYDDSE